MSDLSIDQGQAEASTTGTTTTSSSSPLPSSLDLPPPPPAKDDDAGLADPRPATPIAAPTAAQPPTTTSPANDEADLSWLGPLIHDGTETASQADCPDADPVTVPVPTAPETPPPPPPPASNSSHSVSSTVPCPPCPPLQNSPQALRHTPSYAAAPDTSQNNTTNTTSSSTSSSLDITENKPDTTTTTTTTTTNNNNIARRNTLQSPPNTDPLIASPDLISSHQTRKLSPGLAARLKALGLGTSKKLSYVTTVNDRIGKLSEDQIRQIEESHQRHSAAENLVIERRGKPWKGVVRIPSKSSLKSTKSAKDDAITPEDIDVPTIRIVDSPPPAENTPDLILDGFEASEAIDMNTNKFRLPDYGNGTNVTLETRQEHIARDTIVPPFPEEFSMPPMPPSPPPAEEPLSLEEDVPEENFPEETFPEETFPEETFPEESPMHPSPPPTEEPLSPEEEDVPPPPPAKDTPPLPAEPFSPQEDFLNPLGLQRPGSVYTISRASFANQLEQLTSLQLPDAESLAGKVAAIPTAQAAVRALIGAAEQIRSWIYKASEVISGLDSDDDVEWSAAGGREGLEEVESATSRFAGLIDVYVTAIEELQTRNDIANVSTDDLTRAVMQMEAIMEEWTNIRSTLRSVRGQVEIAMEWEELWNGVLGEIETELSELRRLVFEMEERRHKSAMATANGDMVDMGDLRTIMEETRSANSRARPITNRFSLADAPTSPRSPSPNGLAISADDSSVLALFARMQPLRASLDFLPMRLSTFEARADTSFPTACEELDMRREALEASFKKLQKDADGLRKELGEDRWVLVFRGAARQAEKMTDSVDRSVAGLKEAVDAGMHLTNQPALLKKIESYEAKKTHYGPAIDRVLLIIERGVKDRLTVNGEILRLHTEMQAKWQDIKNDMKETDMVLDELHTDKWGTNLRDSISSMLSNEVSSTAGSGLETPYSSPPSSVIMSGLGASVRTPGSKSTTPATRVRRSSSSVSGGLSQSGGRRATTATTPAIKRKPVPQASTYGGASSSPIRGNKTAIPSSTRYAASIPRPASTLAHRPRWNGSTKTSDLDVGHNFQPLSLTAPSPYAKYKKLTTPIRSHSSLAAPMNSISYSKLPMRSSRAMSPSPMPDTPPRPVSKLNLPRLRSVSSSNRQKSLMPPGAEEHGMAPRPATSLATTNRRTSMLPMPKFRKEVTTAADGGRASPMPTSFSSRLGLIRGTSSTPTGTNDRTYKDNKPRWRHG